MALPTERALKRKPLAVVILVSPTNQPGKEIEYDFEWFESPEGMREHFDYVHKWFERDLKESEGDLCYMALEVTDTTELKTGRTCVVPVTDKMKKWRDRVKKNPTLMLVPVETPQAEEQQVKPRVKPKGGVAKTSETPTVKSKKVVPPKKAAAKKQAEAEPVTPQVKAANLKARLAAKKKAAQAEAESVATRRPTPTKKAAAKAGN